MGDVAPKFVVIDYETYYDKEYSLRKMNTQQYILDPRFKAHGVGVKVGDSETIWVPHKLIKPVLSKVIPGNVVIHHNANFDGAISEWIYGLSPRMYIDTVSMSRAVLGDRLKSHSLDSVAEFLLGERKGDGLAVSMGVRDLDSEQERILATYCKRDCDLTWGIFKKLIAGFPRGMLPMLDWTTRAFVQPRLLLDVPMLEEHLARLQEEKAKVLVSAGLDSPEALMSNDKFALALQTLGVEPPTKISPTTGKVAFAFAKTDEGLKELAEHEDTRVQALVAARLAHKSTLEETRTESYIIAGGFGPWPVDYKYAGATNTLRFSGSNGAGGNPQNLPRKSLLRKAIMAADGKVLIVSDLSQIELRIVLALAGETEALDILREGGDLYCWFATRIFGREITKADEDERQMAKSAVLGLGFGMGVDKFILYCKQQGVPMTREMAEFIVKLYRETFPGVVKLWRTAEADLAYALNNQAVSFGRLSPSVVVSGHAPVLERCPGFKLPSGHWVKYPGLRKDEEGQWSYMTAFGERRLWGGVVVENVVQALAADIIKEQTLTILNDIRLPVVMMTHDETVTEGDEDYATEQMAAIVRVMSAPLKWWPDLPLACEAHFAKRYGEAK